MLTTSFGHPHIPRLLKYINPLRWAKLYLIFGYRILEQNKIKKIFLPTRAIEWGPPLAVKALPVTANGGRCRALKIFF